MILVLNCSYKFFILIPIHFQAMLHRWPSWAPKGEYLHVEKMKLISPFVPKLGFPALFRVVNGTIFVPIIQVSISPTFYAQLLRMQIPRA